MRVLAVVFALALVGGCTQIDRYNNADAKPGGTVVGSSPFRRATASLGPRGPQWIRFRVIAPPDATVCRITGQSIFARPGPETQGKPNEKREVMLTYDVDAKSASFECKTPSGILRRTVQAVRYDMMSTLFDGKPRLMEIAWVKPPLVHMDPKDPEAEARWAALGVELCSGPYDGDSHFTCKPGMLEKLKAVDLAAAG
jgi:hypothetical protein